MIFTEIKNEKNYITGFVPYGFAAFLVGIVGGFTTVLGPAFVSDLSLDYNNTTWTALALAVSSAVFAPVLGKTADVIGRRKTLLFGVAVFTLGNMLTAIASSLLFMLAARFVVGIGSAAVAPVVMSYIVTNFPPQKIAKGFSLYMLISSAAVVFGPTLGGFIIERYGWRAMMWLCTATSLLVLFVCAFTLEKAAPMNGGGKSFDAWGTVFILLFFGSVLCVPSFGQSFGWSSTPFLISTVLAVLTGACLMAVEKRAANPVLQLPFIKRKAFILSVVALFLTQGLMQANMTDIIVFVKYTMPQNTIISSYAISLMYVGMSLGALLLGPLADRREPKTVLAFSFLLTGIGCGIMLLFSAQTSLVLLASSLGILGFGLGGNAAIFMKIVFYGVTEKAAGAGTGTYGLFRDLAAPFGVAVFVPMFTNGVTAAVAQGKDTALAAVHSIRVLAVAELLCVAAGIVTVLFLPKIQSKGEKYAIKG